LFLLSVALSTSREFTGRHQVLRRHRDKEGPILQFTPASGDICTRNENTQPSFDIILTAQNLLGSVSIAYCRIDKILGWRCPACSNDFTVQGVYQTTRTAGYIVENGATILVAFRGTTTMASKFADLNAFPTPYPPDAETSFLGCEHCVHRGFLGEYEEIMNTGMRAMFQTTLARLPDANIFLAGHSAGGCVAELLAYDTASLWTPEQRLKLNVYTFGAPRIFTEGMMSEYNTLVPNTFRFVYRNDPIPHLPPTFLGYSHAGLLVYCTEPNMMVGCACKGLVDGDGGSLATHHDTADHSHGFGANLDFYNRASIRVGCDGRAAEHEWENDIGDLSPKDVPKLERPQDWNSAEHSAEHRKIE